MKVAGHIYPAAAIENAVRAGVDSVEHGSFATAETFALMKARGTYPVPTLRRADGRKPRHAMAVDAAQAAGAACC